MRPGKTTDYDAVVVGSGPNGLAAAITLQQAGLSVLLLEAKSTVGGGMRTQESTLPGFFHDTCSAVHPLAQALPFFNSLPLTSHGLEWIEPEIPAAHPLYDEGAAVLYLDIQQTADSLDGDRDNYLKLVSPLLKNFSKLITDAMAPVHIPKHPLQLLSFGRQALKPAMNISEKSSSAKAKALWAGMAAHTGLPLTAPGTSAAALILFAIGHQYGWPIPKGGSGAIAGALQSYFLSIGGEVITDFPVNSLTQLPSSKIILFDVTPKQLLQIAGDKFSSSYKKKLEDFKYGCGVFKIDLAMDGIIPFSNEHCKKAGTVHLGNTLEEIAAYEKSVYEGRLPGNPFVLLSQPSVFDATRAPAGKHTAWAYCHVPNGSEKDMTNEIESRVESFAPGFRERILARRTMNSAQMESYNPNYIGGDINGGALSLKQFFMRPKLFSPYNTSVKGMYVCSASTPPGGGVHGMCGYYAAKKALKDEFGIQLSPFS